MSMKPWVVTLLATYLLFAQPAHAQMVSEKGMASVTYNGRSAGPEQRQEALRKAKVNALERYIADTNSARSRIFDAQRERIEDHVDDYILGATVLSDAANPQSRTYDVVVRADINSTRLLNDLGVGSASAAQVVTTDHGTMTLLFLARSQDSVQSFDDKVYKRADVDADDSRSTHEGESVRGDAVETSDRITRHASVATTTGGSVTRKADKIEWTVGNAGGIETAMTSVFTSAGYDVVEAAQVESASGGLLNIENIRAAYSHGNDLPSTLVVNTTQGVQRAGIGLLALGTLDIGMRDRDPVSGNVRVHVGVSGKVFNVQGRFARTIASIGPLQYAGLGPDASVATTNALNEAATKAAQQIVDELNNKGIH